MHSFEVHSNESACRKSGRLGLEQVLTVPTQVQFLIYFSLFDIYAAGDFSIFNLMFS